MDPVTIAISVIGALASSGVGGSILSGIAGMLGGSKGSDVAKTVIDTANKVFGTTDPKAIELAIAQDKTKADRFTAQLTADTEQFRIQVEDTKDARARDVAIHATSGGNLRANIMIVAGFLYLMGGTAFIFFNITELSTPGAIAVMTFLTTTMGGVSQWIGQAFNFEFGSSRGSAQKSDQLADIASAKK